MNIEVWPATAGRFDDVATMLGLKNPDSSVLVLEPPARLKDQPSTRRPGSG